MADVDAPDDTSSSREPLVMVSTFSPDGASEGVHFWECFEAAAAAAMASCAFCTAGEKKALEEDVGLGQEMEGRSAKEGEGSGTGEDATGDTAPPSRSTDGEREGEGKGNALPVEASWGSAKGFAEEATGSVRFSIELLTLFGDIVFSIPLEDDA